MCSYYFFLKLKGRPEKARLAGRFSPVISDVKADLRYTSDAVQSVDSGGRLDSFRKQVWGLADKRSLCEEIRWVFA
jgi:hypothetical protein